MTTTFSPIDFKDSYPQFADVSNSKLTNEFNYVASQLGQVVSALWEDDNTKYYWLCIVLAHIMTIEQTGQAGRPSSVSQGSESVTFELPTTEWDAYWNQTVYGQKIAQAMKTFLAGGHYISDGTEPYLSNSMNGAYEQGWAFAGEPT